LKEIRRERPGVPVIAQTAYVMPAERKAIDEAGFDGFLGKPLEMNELYSTLNRALERD